MHRLPKYMFGILRVSNKIKTLPRILWLQAVQSHLVAVVYIVVGIWLGATVKGSGDFTIS
jgi:hypothetical protein